ncbi:MAG TPA: hypothetical protein DCS93_12960 [Microscillaceae bacterium]|nr:hypothetical protein [Microscillaceae bacterium]
MKTPTSLHRLVGAAVDACQAEGYQVTIFDPYFIEITDGVQVLQMGIGSSFGFAPINTQCSVANDKTRTLLLLKRAGFTVTEGQCFFTFHHPHALSGQLPADALVYAQALGYPVFAKPNAGSLSKLAAKVYSPEELTNQITAIEPTDRLLRVERPIDLPEYRMVMIDGEFQYSCRKEIPTITGDGIHSVEALIAAFNTQAATRAQTMNEPFEPLNLHSTYLQNQLQEQGIGLDSILKQGTQLTLTPTPIARQGGTKQAYSETISEATRNWLEQVGKTLNLRVFGLDVFAKGPIDDPDNLIILEANHNPIHRHVPEPKVVYMMRLVVRKYFEEQRIIRASL